MCGGEGVFAVSPVGLPLPSSVRCADVRRRFRWFSPLVGVAAVPPSPPIRRSRGAFAGAGAPLAAADSSAGGGFAGPRWSPPPSTSTIRCADVLRRLGRRSAKTPPENMLGRISKRRRLPKFGLITRKQR